MKTYKEFNLELQERVNMAKGVYVGAKLSARKLGKAMKHLKKVGADFRFQEFGDDFLQMYPQTKGPARTFGRKDLRKLGGAKTSTSIVPSNLKPTSIVGKKSKYEPSTIRNTGELTQQVSKKTRRMMGRQMKADGMVGRKDQIDFNLDRRYGNPSKRFRKRQQRELGRQREKEIRARDAGEQQDMIKYADKSKDAYKVN
jgi:hypothetical protein